jgi:hypothetical protein
MKLKTRSSRGVELLTKHLLSLRLIKASCRIDHKLKRAEHHNAQGQDGTIRAVPMKASIFFAHGATPFDVLQAYRFGRIDLDSEDSSRGRDLHLV